MRRGIRSYDGVVLHVIFVLTLSCSASLHVIYVLTLNSATCDIRFNPFLSPPPQSTKLWRKSTWPWTKRTRSRRLRLCSRKKPNFRFSTPTVWTSIGTIWGERERVECLAMYWWVLCSRRSDLCDYGREWIYCTIRTIVVEPHYWRVEFIVSTGLRFKIFSYYILCKGYGAKSWVVVNTPGFGKRLTWLFYNFALKFQLEFTWRNHRHTALLRL